jgi:hypothetical protein
MKSANGFERERRGAKRQRMAIGDSAFAGIGGDHRRRQHFGKRRELLGGFGVMHALARPQDRVLGRQQHLGGFPDGVGIRRGALHRHRHVIERALVFGGENLVGHLDQDGTGLAAAHGLIGAPQQVRQFLRRVRQRRPFGHRPKNLGGAECRPHILPGQRHAAGNDQKRDVLGKRLRHPGKGVLDAGPHLGGEDAVALAALDPGKAIGDADADALLPAQDRPDIKCRAGLDHRVTWIARQEFGAFALEDFGDNFGSVHRTSSLVRRLLWPPS